MIKKLILIGLAIIFPCLVLLIYDLPAGAFLALVMQATIIGWIPASLWALRLIKKQEKP